MPQQFKVTVWRTMEISCAHNIPNHPGKCRGLHGHNYQVEVGIKGYIDDSTGMVKDFGDVKLDMNAVIYNPCDHKYLNDVYPQMLTTAENLCQLWLNQLCQLDERYVGIRVHETGNCLAEIVL